ncbi:intracellular protein transport protein USO1-like isoform X2 [Chenopodium quinoa]|uniref:intracellular protein transport protein USO1-like isoform X2 n=1 Tax=Chenopodium quinoa TaxID=63459 RepID=UPI000B76F1B3|nr:intracellular protein transport protein USO1-like isoform X2 [Chenopodium quinoa]
MGVCSSRPKRGNYAWENDPRMFIQKMRLLQQEINAILKQREEETEVYEKELMVFAFREAEWKKERKKLKEEVKGLKKSLEEREERIRQMEEEAKGCIGLVRNSEISSDGVSTDCRNSSNIAAAAAATSLSLMEQMREERARRDEAVEKWKMLYLAIKHELDDLIQRTHEGTLNWRADEEELMEDLQRELKARDETIQVLKAQLASMEDEEYKRKREVDILRQSLRIMSINSNNKVANSSARVNNLSKPSIRFAKLAFVN